MRDRRSSVRSPTTPVDSFFETKQHRGRMHSMSLSRESNGQTCYANANFNVVQKCKTRLQQITSFVRFCIFFQSAPPSFERFLWPMTLNNKGTHYYSCSIFGCNLSCQCKPRPCAKVCRANRGLVDVWLAASSRACT